MANPCFVTHKGVEYTYPEWIEYLANGGLDKLIEDGLVKGIKPIGDVIPEVVIGGKSFTISNKGDVYEALKELGYDDNLAKANADLMEMAADAANKRYGVSKEAYYNMTIRNYSLGDKGVEQVDVMHGTPYKFPKEILVEMPDGKQEYLVGTPDVFPDIPQGAKVIKEFPKGRFKTSQIGTGEGAQAFGWGLYFTDLEGIAKNYAEKLAKSKMTILTDGKKINLDSDTFTNAEEIAYGTLEVDYTVEKAIKRLEYNQTKRPQDDNLKAIEILKRTKVEGSRSLYKVSIHKGKSPSEYTWLEWDKPLSSEQKNKLEKALKGELVWANGEQLIRVNIGSGDFELIKTRRGAEAYNKLSRLLGGDKQASLFLLENGIDGVKYPAESIARGSTSDTARGFNYVVFDENAIEIQEAAMFQGRKNAPRGRFSVESGKDVVELLKAKNASTFPHELGHKHLQTIIDLASTNDMAKKDLEILAKEYVRQTKSKASVNEVMAQMMSTDKALMDNSTYRSVHEFFTNGFERWLREGEKAGFSEEMVRVFEQFKQYLMDVYNTITNTRLAEVELSPEMNKLYNDIFGGDWEQIKKNESNAKNDIATRDIAMAIKEKDVDVGGLDNFFGEEGKGLSQQKPTMLQKIFEEVLALKREGYIDQYNAKEYMLNYLEGLKGQSTTKDVLINEAINLVNANEKHIVNLAKIDGNIRSGFINALQSKELTKEEQRLLRKSDVATYVKVSLKKLGKTAEQVISDLTFDEALDIVPKMFNLDFANDESLSESVAILAAVINKGRNEMKSASDKERENYANKLQDLYERYSVVGTIMGKGVNALKLMAAIDPNWFVANLRKEMDKDIPAKKKTEYENAIKELKQKAQELDNYNTDLLNELADKEGKISELLKAIEKVKKTQKAASEERETKITPPRVLSKEERANKEALLKQKMDMLKNKLKERGLNQDPLDEMSESELIQSIARDYFELELASKKSVPINKFATFIKSNFGDVDYDLGAIYRGMVGELSSQYKRDAFSSEQTIEDFLSGGQEAINEKLLKLAELEAERDLIKKKKEELKTLRRLMQVNKAIADKKVKDLADFAKNKIIESGLWGQYLEAYSGRLANEMGDNILTAMGYKREGVQKAMLDEFSQALSANISALINERFPVDKESAKKIDYAQRLRDISANKEKFEQMFQDAIAKVEKRFKDNPDVKNILAAMSKDKNVFSSKMMKSAIFDKLNNLETKIGDFVLKDSAEKESMTEAILKDIAIDDTGLRNALKYELGNIEADLLGGASMNVAERIMKDITNETKGYTSKETTLIQKVKNALITQYKESVKDKRVKPNRSESDLLSDALGEAMHIEGGKMFASIQETIGKFIDGTNWTPEEKQKAREFISDYQKSVYQSLVTAKVGGEIISNAVIKAGYLRRQTIDGKEKLFPDWKGLVTDVKANRSDVVNVLRQTLIDQIGDKKFADDIINHIVDMYDMRVGKEQERFIASEIAKIAAKNNVNTSKGKVTSKLKSLSNINNALDGLDNPKFKQEFAEYFGLTKISDEELRHISMLLDRVREAPDGVLRNERAEVAAGVIDFYKSRANFTLAMILSNMYSSVLSHPSTTFVNAYLLPRTAMIAATKSILNPAYGKVFMRAMKSGVFKSGVVEGRLNAPDDFSLHTNIKYRPEEVIHEVMPTSLEVYNKLKKGELGKAFGNLFLGLSSKGLQYPFVPSTKNAITFTKLLTRVQNATDALVQMGMGNMKAYEYFYKEAIKEGKTKEDAMKQAWEKLFPMDYSEAKVLAEEEYFNRGITPSLIQVQTRANEIIKQQRSKDVNNMIERIGLIAAMRDKPQTLLTGNAGLFESSAWAIEAFSESALRKLEKNKTGQAFFSIGKYTSFPFVRTIGHLLDRGIDATGLGIARGGLRQLKNVYYFDNYSNLRHDVEKGKLTKDEAMFIEAFKAQRSFTDAFIGIASIGIIQSLISSFGDDEDGFYGNNEKGGDIARKKGLRNVLRFQGHNIPMAYLGVLAPVGYIIGNISDNIRNAKGRQRVLIKNPKKLIEDYEGSLMQVPIDAMKSIAQSSFLPTTSTIFRDDMKATAKIGRIIATDMVGAFGMPHRMINDLYQFADPKSKEAVDFADGLLKAMPYLDMLPYVDRSKPAFDYLGRQIYVGERPSMAISSIVDSFKRGSKNNAIDDFFIDNRMSVPDINKSATTWLTPTLDRTYKGIIELSTPDYTQMYDIYRITGMFFGQTMQRENNGTDGSGLNDIYDKFNDKAIEEALEYKKMDKDERSDYIQERQKELMQEYINERWKEAERDAYQYYNEQYGTNFKKKGIATKEEMEQLRE
jgi:hypothetical protein